MLTFLDLIVLMFYTDKPSYSVRNRPMSPPGTHILCQFSTRPRVSRVFQEVGANVKVPSSTLCLQTQFRHVLSLSTLTFDSLTLPIRWLRYPVPYMPSDSFVLLGVQFVATESVFTPCLRCRPSFRRPPFYLGNEGFVTLLVRGFPRLTNWGSGVPPTHPALAPTLAPRPIEFW